MNWYRSPEVVDQLAAAYVLGSLHGPARRRFEAILRTQALARASVAAWEQRLQPLAERLPPVAPHPDVLRRIEAHARGDAPAGSAPAGRWGWLQRWFGPVPASALALGLMLGLLWPALLPPAGDGELPSGYIGVLANAEGKTGMIVASRRQGRVMDLKQVQPLVLPAGQTLFVWAIEASGRARPVGPAPSGTFVQVPLPAPAEALFFTAAEVAISLEPVGSAPTAPTTPFVYRGLCGKLWRP